MCLDHVCQNNWVVFSYSQLLGCVFAGDDKRVKLKEIKGEKGSDYINATFIEVSMGESTSVFIQRFIKLKCAYGDLRILTISRIKRIKSSILNLRAVIWFSPFLCLINPQTPHIPFHLESQGCHLIQSFSMSDKPPNPNPPLPFPLESQGCHFMAFDSVLFDLLSCSSTSPCFSFCCVLSLLLARSPDFFCKILQYFKTRERLFCMALVEWLGNDGRWYGGSLFMLSYHAGIRHYAFICICFIVCVHCFLFL